MPLVVHSGFCGVQRQALRGRSPRHSHTGITASQAACQHFQSEAGPQPWSNGALATGTEARMLAGRDAIPQALQRDPL